MKAKIMSLNSKEGLNEYACSKCFSILDEEDKYCWGCGAELDTENIAYDSEDLKRAKLNKIIGGKMIFIILIFLVWFALGFMIGGMVMMSHYERRIMDDSYFTNDERKELDEEQVRVKSTKRTRGRRLAN